MSSVSRCEPIEVLQRRSARAETDGEPVFGTAIDHSRWFISPTLTPLYYASIYRELTETQRRRYNQLTGLCFNELIAFFEESFAASVLAAVADRRTRGDDPRFVECLDGFLQDERRHISYWRRLNRLSEPDLYANGESVILRLSPIARSGLRFLTRRPRQFPVVFWIMLALEERSLEISRCCLADDPALVEPTYRSVYQHHMRDEARHVQLDLHLIERFFVTTSPQCRKRNATLLAMMIRRFFLPPVRSAVQVVRRLATEFPELKPRLPDFQRQLRQVGESLDYHEMMYSRRSTPILFRCFDRFEEMHVMQSVLTSYSPFTQANV